MNDDIEASIDGLFEKFVGLVRLYEELESTPRRYGTNELLTSSEIHLIERIGDNVESLSVTDLAGLIGVTKGAVSQHLKRLATKELTKKEEDPRNLSRSIVKLTSKGKAAYYSHKHWHEKMDGGYKAYFTSLDQDRVRFLYDFMARVEDFLTRAINAKS
jgi:DNA-binding MarR family transcriptional regulator